MTKERSLDANNDLSAVQSLDKLASSPMRSINVGLKVLKRMMIYLQYSAWFSLGKVALIEWYLVCEVYKPCAVEAIFTLDDKTTDYIQDRVAVYKVESPYV